jgi:hypothetical protein
MLDMVHYLNSMIEKVLKPHIPKQGGHFKAIPQALLEVLLGSFGSFILGGTKVLVCGSSALQAAAE